MTENLDLRIHRMLPFYSKTSILEFSMSHALIFWLLNLVFIQNMDTLKTELINHLPGACLEDLEAQILFLQKLVTGNFPLYIVQSTKIICLMHYKGKR